MPPHNGEGVAGKLASRSRPAPARIVPAIPLSLVRSKPNKNKQNAVAVAVAASSGEDATSKQQAKELQQEQEQSGGMEQEQEQEQVAATTETVKPVPTAELDGGRGHGHGQAGHEVQAETGENDQVTAPSGVTPASRSSAAMSASEASMSMSMSMSDDGRPASERVHSAELLANGEAETQDPIVTSSPSTVRKPSDRFEMRQIRTELPPAFVPAEQFTPHSATSSQAQARQHVLPHAHPTNPSVGSIVFGGHDSSGSSPAPPMSAGSAYMPPRNQPYGHAHHGSESQGRFQGGEPFNPRQQSFAPSVPQPPYPSNLEHPHAHFRYPPREGFTSGGINSPPNGFGSNSRSGSPFTGPDNRYVPEYQFAPGLEQLPNGGKPIPQGPRGSLTRNARPMSQQVPYNVPPPPPLFPYPELATSFENAESLRGYAFGHFNNGDLADCILEVLDEFGGRQVLQGHRIILSRSPVLSAIIRNSDAPTAAVLKPLVRVYLTGKQVRIHPFLQAIRYLYGGPLPPFDIYDSNVPFGGPNVSVNERMDSALQHIATGCWLGIAAIAHRGVDMAASLLTWDTISSALEFALDGGISQMWPIDDGEEQTSTCSSSDDSMTKPEAGGSPKYGHYASGLLQRVIEFTVQNTPPNFYIDTAAPPSPVVPRLPIIAPKHESKSSIAKDARLSQIKFGEMSAEVDNHQRPSPTATAISSILLSLPFPLLRYLLEHFLLTERLGAETVASIMRQIVGERENRRQKALKVRAATHNDDGLDTHLVQNLYWQESVEFSDQSRAGFRLARKRVGIETPPSSGTEDERNNVRTSE